MIKDKSFMPLDPVFLTRRESDSDAVLGELLDVGVGQGLGTGLCEML